MSWLPDAERPCCQVGAVGAAVTIARQGGGMVVSTDWRQAVKVGGCCCCKATCKCANLVMPAASMRG